MWQSGVNLVEGSRDLIDASIRSRAHVRAGMKHDSADAEALGAIELVDHRRDRFAMKLAICGCKVDEIRRMRENRLDCALLREESAVVVGQLLAFPLIGVLRENR